MQPRWKGAVRVQFNKEAQRADAPEKAFQLRLKQRLAAGHGHAVEQTAPFFQKAEEFFLRDVLAAAQHQRRVVAEGTAKVAAGQENRAGDAAGVVQKRHFLQTADAHDVPPKFSDIFCLQTQYIVSMP